jgi:hypothetical protein
LFAIKIEVTALLKIALTFKIGTLQKITFLPQKISDFILKEVLGLRFFIYFKDLHFYRKKAYVCAFL